MLQIIIPTKIFPMATKKAKEDAECPQKRHIMSTTNGPIVHKNHS
jgi:hypothetical protein